MNRVVEEFRLICESYPNSFNSEINRYLNKGWELKDELFFEKNNYSQIMIRYKKQNKKDNF
jgi:hypothetical protein